MLHARLDVIAFSSNLRQTGGAMLCSALRPQQSLSILFRETSPVPLIGATGLRLIFRHRSANLCSSAKSDDASRLICLVTLRIEGTFFEAPG